MASSLASQSLHLHNLSQLFFTRLLFGGLLMLLISCNPYRKLSKEASAVLNDTNLVSANVGISIFDPSSSKTIYSHNSSRYFIPASNTKLYTCYAAMKYLGDSIPGVRYHIINDTTVAIAGTGDPTFLVREFPSQPVLHFLKGFRKIVVVARPFDDYLGNGWAWNDYRFSYMAQRGALPIYGNLVGFRLNNSGQLEVTPRTFPYRNTSQKPLPGFSISKDLRDNDFVVSVGNARTAEMPFTPTHEMVARLLADTLKAVYEVQHNMPTSGMPNLIYSQHIDSMLKPMMHRSDNFYAEQTLLMVSDKLLGILDDSRIIDTLVKKDLRQLPQLPGWMDGSGLSRYNLFTPDDMVGLLNMMKNEFSWTRITTILPTGGEGTLSSYYRHLSGRIFAKTGTLRNNVALSGYLVTKNNKTLIFSVMVNNHMSDVTKIRRAVEKFLTYVAENN